MPPKSMPQTFEELLARIETESRVAGRDLCEFARRLGLDPERDFIGADITGVNFNGRSLARFNFKDADLSGADLRGTGIRRSQLVGATLDDALVDLGLDDDAIHMGDDQLWNVAYNLKAGEDFAGPRNEELLSLMRKSLNMKIFFIERIRGLVFPADLSDLYEILRDISSLNDGFSRRTLTQAFVRQNPVSLNTCMQICSRIASAVRRGEDKRQDAFLLSKLRRYVVDENPLASLRISPSWYRINVRIMSEYYGLYRQIRYLNDPVWQRLDATELSHRNISMFLKKMDNEVRRYRSMNRAERLMNEWSSFGMTHYAAQMIFSALLPDQFMTSAVAETDFYSVSIKNNGSSQFYALSKGDGNIDGMLQRGRYP